MRRIVLAAGVALASPAMPQDLVFPVDCVLGETCVIQQYVDRDPGPGATDFTCGPLTYDGHKGTDIRLPDLAAMQRGVAVLSATSGRVVALRDGVPDIAYGADNAPDISGRECGNGVVMQRADGWRFQYCHLKRGSVLVETGDLIEAGDPIGEVGLSGRTQFPHLHLTIRDQAGRIFDPFDARQNNASCKLRERRSLWKDLGAADYQPGGHLASGFSNRPPTYDEVRAGLERVASMPRDSEAIVYWAHYFGLREGDEILLQLLDPKDKIIAEDRVKMNRNRATQYRAVGRKSRGEWETGAYRGISILLRDGHPVDSSELKIEIR